jgi:DNA topoisomerase-2
LLILSVINVPSPLLFKGLGTSTTDDAKKYFNNMDKHRKEFKTATEDDRLLIDMAFNKKKADDRKEWLRQFVVKNEKLSHS